jgi:hypothetical protein
MKMIVEKQMECRLAGETEVLGENLPQRHFCPSQNPTCPGPGLNPGRRGEKPATNRLSYGAADPRAILRLEGFGKLVEKKSSSGLDSATFRLVALCFNQLPYRVLPNNVVYKYKANNI